MRCQEGVSVKHCGRSLCIVCDSCFIRWSRRNTRVKLPGGGGFVCCDVMQGSIVRRAKLRERAKPVYTSSFRTPPSGIRRRRIAGVNTESDAHVFASLPRRPSLAGKAVRSFIPRVVRGQPLRGPKVGWFNGEGEWSCRGWFSFLKKKWK